MRNVISEEQISIPQLNELNEQATKAKRYLGTIHNLFPVSPDQRDVMLFAVEVDMRHIHRHITMFLTECNYIAGLLVELNMFYSKLSK